MGSLDGALSLSKHVGADRVGRLYHTAIAQKCPLLQSCKLQTDDGGCDVKSAPRRWFVCARSCWANCICRRRTR